MLTDIFDTDKRYSVIYADPPWSYTDNCHSGKRGVEYKYQCMSLPDIYELPVDSIAADDCALFLWATMPMLQAALDVIDAWGFDYKTVAFVWIKKTTRSGANFWGMGNWTRANAEVCLLATRGRPKRVCAAVHQVIEAPIGRHSAKPSEARDRIVQLLGDVQRIELFARETAPGWDCWGNDPALRIAREQAQSEDRLIERQKTLGI